MILPIVICFSAPVAAESLYIRKIVSVVYDDSASMTFDGSKYKYASYAMQAFCGMLNSEDQLYVTYMSQPFVQQEIDLSAGGIQDSIKSIPTRENQYNAGTPFLAVEKAYEKLISVQDDNPNTEYWLVVITDGDFNEIENWSKADKENFLNEKMESFSSQQMPNKTRPQINYVGIGDVAMPTEDLEKGIYTYAAQTKNYTIEDAMSDMADRISGRSRLKDGAVEKVDGKTVKVSSTIPLLNIAAFAQGTDAQIVEVKHDNKTVPISRKAVLNVLNIQELTGSAYLIGDSQKAMGSGDYFITFDKDINLDNIVVLFEPALEVRISVKVNGKEIKDLSKLDLMDKDKISVSYKLYEMGTNNEINQGILPPNTKYGINVYENDTVVKQLSGYNESLVDYKLKEVKTRINASVTIEGFNPIEVNLEFTPKKYIPKINYEINPFLGDENINSIWTEKIGQNEDLTICFTVTKQQENENGDMGDKIQITDPDELKALGPVITSYPQGNDGEITYTNDGKIIFTPKSASDRPGSSPTFDVTVTCTINDGTSASEKYTIDAGINKAVFVAPDKQIRKTELYQNNISASFYITREGVKLTKEQIGDIDLNNFTLNRSRRDLKIDYSVDPDGTITVTPYSTEEEERWPFLAYWFQYFFVTNGSDITITFEHEYATTKGTMDVIGGNGTFVFFNVLLWLGIELLIIIMLIVYGAIYIGKPRFNSKAVIYLGNVWRDGDNGCFLRLQTVELKQYNKFKHLWNPFKKKLTVDLGKGLVVSALKYSKIECKKSPRYETSISPKPRKFVYEHPKDVIEYCNSTEEGRMNKGLKIAPIAVADETKVADSNCTIFNDPTAFHFINAKYSTTTSGTRKIQIIETATAFCYVVEEDKKKK